MEARGRRFSGGFPGYDGPALPRAMRSSRGRGEAARRQSAVVARTGFFELLATVAGRILQDTGINSGQCNKANNVNEQESLKENLPSEIDSQVSSSPSIEIKEITSISELQGVCTEMKQFPDDEMQGHFEMIEMMVSEQIMEGEKQATLGFAAGDITSSSMEFKQLPTMVQEKPTTEMNVISVEKGGKESRGYLEAMGEVMVQALEAPIAVMTEADSLIPEFQMHCQSSESGDVMKLTSPMDLGEDKDDENASMEDKGIVVDEKIPPSVATSGCSKVAPPAGLAEGQGMTRPVLKQVNCKKHGKMSRMEKVCSSQCLVPETNLKDPYRKGLESQKNAEAVKWHLSVSLITKQSQNGCSICSPATVKLSIKSFTVPELFVDLPESASILNLKRAVMEAAMNLLGGGLRVRVLLQGKKVPDEGATLLQMGISRSAKPESLGFMLEPSPVPTSTSATAAEDPLLGCNSMKTKLTHLNERMAVSPHSTRVAAAGALAAIRAQADANRRAKNELDPSSTVTTNMSQDSLGGESGAIILHPGVGTGENMPGMALVPVRQKTGALDVGKRRMRCPFSVAEVEALVHAVEKLGTGRWRDVKLRAFDHAKHRTYVDLKDKWKTLVHTARIAPHQRRGEPVPQELLERVTRAHSYWSAQAAKQQAELDF
ncbi:unnamed protein product [Sphagnum jensenii]|uniref:Uncharacterized protein n=1 Tax=Sphagnum jensenii TaxID=128206 RepID=A0ABP1BII3_9BRYO